MENTNQAYGFASISSIAGDFKLLCSVPEFQAEVVDFVQKSSGLVAQSSSTYSCWFNDTRTVRWDVLMNIIRYFGEHGWEPYASTVNMSTPVMRDGMQGIGTPHFAYLFRKAL